jgi:L-cysteine S-thiosulfotransferase
MRKFIIAGAIIAGMAAAGAATAGEDKPNVKPSDPNHPLEEIISGYNYRTEATRSLQDDDFENPAMLWVDQGEELWDTKDGKAGKACADCHDDASESMAKTGAQFPKWNASAGKPLNLEQQINQCRTDRMEAKPFKYESGEMLGMTAFVRMQSRGEPVDVQVDGKMKPHFEGGKKYYYERRGQLDMACAHCHELYAGQNIRADLLSQGQSNGFPTYRLKWQKIGSLHRRFRGCNKQVRAKPQSYGHDDYVNLELYLAWRGKGLEVEAPAVRQ